MKIGSCTVVYNPNSEVLENLKSYTDLVHISVVVDNSDTKNEISNLLKNDPDYVYIDMHGNKGIAQALNFGIRYLNRLGLDFVLTMDQDSTFPAEYYLKIVDLIEKYQNEYSVIGLNFNHANDVSNSKITDVPYWLTSGNFVKIHDFIKVGGFMDELFIDFVDFELGYKLYKNNLKIGYLDGFSILHTIGNPIEIHILNKTYHAMNHAPIRYYYRFRNSYYLYHFVDKRFFRKEYYKEMYVNLLKMLIYEKNRKFKLQMIHKGLQDAKKKKLGKFLCQ